MTAASLSSITPTTERVNIFSKTRDVQTFLKKHSDVFLISQKVLQRVHPLIKLFFFQKGDTKSTTGREIETFYSFLENSNLWFGNLWKCGRIQYFPDRISKTVGASQVGTYDKRVGGFTGIRDTGNVRERCHQVCTSNQGLVCEQGVPNGHEGWGSLPIHKKNIHRVIKSSNIGVTSLVYQGHNWSGYVINWHITFRRLWLRKTQ